MRPLPGSAAMGQHCDQRQCRTEEIDAPGVGVAVFGQERRSGHQQQAAAIAAAEARISSLQKEAAARLAEQQQAETPNFRAWTGLLRRRWRVMVPFLLAAILFSFQDVPLLKALGFYRVEA